MPLLCFGQFNEDFSDGDFNNNPTWQGDVSDFIVNTYNTLQLNAEPAASEKYLSTPAATLGETTWRFQAVYDFTNPSTSNFAKFYLASDNANLLMPLNGYYIKLGGISGDEDAIELYNQTGSSTELICSGTLGTAASNSTFNIEVLRDDANIWTVNVDTIGNGDYSFQASGIDDEHELGNYIGPTCKFSSTRNEHYFFDNIFVDPIYVDSEAPELLDVIVNSENDIILVFNEAIETASAETIENYFVNNGIGTPFMVDVNPLDPSVIFILFEEGFLNGNEYEITITGLTDTEGNQIETITSTFSFFTAQQFDVVITEFMCKPIENATLPDRDYVEIYNRSNQAINLADWTIADGIGLASIPPYEFLPGTYLILSNTAAVTEFEPFGEVIGIPSFPDFNNSGDLIELKDKNGAIINSITYTDDWYQNETKADDGGWSIEKIDIENLCEGNNNWQASEAESKGTPGQQNSAIAANPDLAEPEISSVQIINSTQLFVQFNEPLDPVNAFNVNSYSLTNIDITEVIASNNCIAFSNCLVLQLASALEENTPYTLSFTNIQDCALNTIYNSSYEIAIPVNAAVGDIIINEIMPNPVSGGYDFVELYNNSNKIIDLSNLSIARADYYVDTLKQIEAISFDTYLFFPNEFIALTENKNHIENQYAPPAEANILQIDDLPTYDDKLDAVVVLNFANSERIDQVNYSDEWHFDLIDIKDGVSLERIDFNGNSQDENNWHSAGTNVNFGTPGYANSQAFTVAGSNQSLSLQNTTISPDGDGFEDFLVLNYTLTEPGWIANIQVFDQRGRYIDHIANNEILNESGHLTWNGTNKNGERIPLGIYVVYSQLFDLNGSIQKFKEPFVVAGKL